MAISYYKELLDLSLLQGVMALLCAYDHAFVPPLSARESTFQTNLMNKKQTQDKPYTYFEGLKHQSFLLCMTEQGVGGFMTFIPDHHIAALLDTPLVYVTTVVVSENLRGKGITKDFYKKLFTLPLDCKGNYATRTWSTNNAHLKILYELGFFEAKRIKDDRGNGIDTVYYMRSES